MKPQLPIKHEVILIPEYGLMMRYDSFPKEVSMMRLGCLRLNGDCAEEFRIFSYKTGKEADEAYLSLLKIFTEAVTIYKEDTK